MATEESLVFLPTARPALAPGDHILTIRQTVTDTQTGGAVLETFTRSQKLVVRTPRLSLDPSLLLTTYPPNGHEGQYGGDLPHAVLTQATLPWQLSAAKPGRDGPPWLALLLFDDRDPLPEPVTMKAADLVSCPSSVRPQRTLRPEEDPAEPVTAITVPLALFQRLAPRLEDLPWLAHARRVAVGGKAASASDKPGRDYAVIVGNRACLPGRRHTAHLVSLEGMGDLLPGGPPGVGADVTSIRLISLASWSFACADADGTFAGQLARVDLGPMALPVRVPQKTDSAEMRTVKEAYAKGYCALNHQLWGGGDTVSWYRGPLLPLKTSPIDIPRPSGSADQLLRYDPWLGMFDVGHAAAWQLGRLLALGSKEFSRALYRHKIRAIREEALARQRAEAAEALAQPSAAIQAGMARTMIVTAPAASISPLPPGARTGTTETACPFDAAGLRDLLRPPSRSKPDDDAVAGTDQSVIRNWLSRLYILYGVPLNYLVPDSAMLPEESIRFFRIDRNWVLALLDGALSIGGDGPTGETTLRRTLIDQALAGLGDARRSLLEEDDGIEAPDEAKSARMVSGFLLRSKVVTGWPGLEARAFATARRDTPLELLRMEKVAPGLLLCVFRGALCKLDLIEPAEGLRFAEPANADRCGDVLSLVGLAKTLKAGDSAQFAAAMARNGRTVTFEMRDQQP